MRTTPDSRAGRTLGALAICASAALWGLDGVVLTPRLFALPVPFVVFLLHAVPFLLMQPFLAGSYRRLAAMPPRGWAMLALVAAAGGLLGTLSIVRALFLVGFQEVSVVVLLQKLQPVFAIALAALLLGEALRVRFLLRAAVALAGAYLLTFGFALPEPATGPATGDRTAEAAAWAALAAASFGSATVFGKGLLAWLDFRDATFGRYGVTAFLALGVALAGEGLPFAAMTPAHWGLVLVIGVTTGSGAIFLYYFGLTRVRAGVSAICELCLPLTAIVLDYAINDSRLAAGQWLGAMLLVSAITLVSIAPRRRAAGSTEPTASGTG